MAINVNRKIKLDRMEKQYADNHKPSKFNYEFSDCENGVCVDSPVTMDMDKKYGGTTMTYQTAFNETMKCIKKLEHKVQYSKADINYLNNRIKDLNHKLKCVKGGELIE